MKSEDKIDVIVEQFDQYGKKWMKIKLLKGNELVPSFEDWYRMIRGLCECELDKYPHLRDPLDMPRRFFVDCFDLSLSWVDLVKKYKIPQR